MANIQASINQAISLTALLATQNPAVKAYGEKKSEIKNIDKKLKNLREEAFTIVKSDTPEDANVYDPVVATAATAMDFSNKGDQEGAAKILEVLPEDKRKEYADVLSAMSEKGQLAVNLKERKFELDPNEQTYKAFKKSAEYLGEIDEFTEAFRQADVNVANKQKALKETRRRILEGTPSDYLLKGDN